MVVRMSSENLASSNSDTRMSIMRIKHRARMDAGFSKTLQCEYDTKIFVNNSVWVLQQDKKYKSIKSSVGVVKNSGKGVFDFS